MCPSTRQLSWCLPPPPPVVTEQPRQTACEQQIFVAHSGGGALGVREHGPVGSRSGGGLPPHHIRGTRPVMSAECLPQGFPKALPPGAVTFWG